MTRQSVTCQPGQALGQGLVDVRLHLAREHLARLEQVERDEADLDVVLELDPGAGRRRLDPQAQGRSERVRAQRRAPAGDVRLRFRPDHLVGLADMRRTLDADDRRLAEVRRDAVVALEGGLDDLLLDVAVERDRDLVPVVLADVDERILLGELGERRAEAALILGSLGEDDGLERRTREARGRFVDPAAARRSHRRRGPYPGRETVAISPAVDRAPARRARRGEDPDSRRLRLVATDPHALARPERAGEQPDVGDPLARGRPFDLEHAAGDGSVGIAASAGEEFARCPPSSSSTPTPCAAEPKNTGWTTPRRVCSASFRRSRG